MFKIVCPTQLNRKWKLFLSGESNSNNKALIAHRRSSCSVLSGETGEPDGE